MGLSLLAFAGCCRLSVISHTKIEIRRHFFVWILRKANRQELLFFASSSDQRSLFRARGQMLGVITNIFHQKIVIFQKMWFLGFCCTSLPREKEVGGFLALYIIWDWAGFESRGAGGNLWFRMQNLKCGWPVLFFEISSDQLSFFFARG